ncbi:PRC-barrel domain-containing protein [Rubripirellula amarantea]|uniref:PRC-barrel domain protein n=1 Tax=Rubripirellula amarantea TaxID=2527999 RepID=A0A5C5WUU3_9BACT|nr:PRC-barrel domain-containing protein [Rubripirellula amarantea]MDA8746559.1 PRC-barrel domain-containing protein [Rubripirellula amarantea]TWT53773.1 PRC-barrel domain protein [Rubripirellula amarantea]
MKRAFQYATAAAVLSCVTLGNVMAQDAATQDRYQTNGVNQQTDAGRLDSKTSGTNIRVSQLIGYNIQNSRGESVGEINDIVLDSKTGKVRYAAVTYGGFLGVGNKMFAVPFEAFRVQADPDEVGDDDIDSDDYVLVLDVTQQQLEGQQGFDEDSWPNMADSQWAADLDKRYGVKRNMDEKDRLMRENRRNVNQ